jgi:hypothetical protein
MDKIIVLSEFGFKLASNPDKWNSCDKKFISSSKFQSLKVNDRIDSFKSNDKGFVTDVTMIDIPQHKELEGGNDSPKSLTKSSVNISVPPSSIIKNSIMFGQCVNIAFASINLGGFVSEEAGIMYAFDRADKIYNEYVKRC